MENSYNNKGGDTRMKKKLTLTVGIPTYYGGPALVNAAKSVLDSKSVDKFRLIVNIDGNPLEPEIEKQLLDLGVDVVFSKERGGQVARIKQMIGMTDTDILVLTQDDIQLAPDTLANILKTFGNYPKLTMIGARMRSKKTNKIMEKIVDVAVEGNNELGRRWKNGNNYLMASGRCMAFRADFIKKFDIPEGIINSDSYLYFENKRKGGEFLALSEAVVFNKTPETLKEHLKQSRKFSVSKGENEKYAGENLSGEYSIPLKPKLEAFAAILLRKHIWAILYLGINLYTKIVGRNMYKDAVRFWETDKTTKKV